MKHENCRELLDSLSDCMDDEAKAKLCAEIKHHMGGCVHCRVVIDTLRKTVTLYHHLPEPTLPDQARERLYKVLDLSSYL